MQFFLSPQWEDPDEEIKFSSVKTQSLRVLPSILVVLESKSFDSLTVGEFLTHTFYMGDSLFNLISMWARKSGHASGTAYDTKHKTLTNKAAQNRQCSIQSVSVESALEV